MNEGTLTKTFMDLAVGTLTRPVKVIKHNDRSTGGIPDVTVIWNGPTSWLEFKYLEPKQTVHDELKPLQLETCVDLEKASQRCWVVAYTRGTPQIPGTTLIYRPTALRGGQLPLAAATFQDIGPGNIRLLWDTGVIRLSGHNHIGLIHLIRLTHS